MNSFLFTSLSNTPDIKSHDIINGACVEESKQTNKKADSKIPIQEGNHTQVLSDYRIRKTSKPKIVSVSIESLIESENVSYIDEEIDKESIKRVDIDEEFQIKMEKTDLQVSIRIKSLTARLYIPLLYVTNSYKMMNHKVMKLIL